VKTGEANEKQGKFEMALKKRVLAFIVKAPPYAFLCPLNSTRARGLEK